MNQTKQKSLSFYPIPQGSSIEISSDDNYVTAEELVSIAMHLSIDEPGRKIRYWIRIEN